jgi:hypothetical protein
LKEEARKILSPVARSPNRWFGATLLHEPRRRKKVSVTHCITFASSGGGLVPAYVQDVLVPGLNADARIGGPVEIYAEFLAFQVSADRLRNVPILLVNRFEPQ